MERERNNLLYFTTIIRQGNHGQTTSKTTVFYQENMPPLIEAGDGDPPLVPLHPLMPPLVHCDLDHHQMLAISCSFLQQKIALPGMNEWQDSRQPQLINTTSALGSWSCSRSIMPN
jgi:hypothetical protein